MAAAPAIGHGNSLVAILSFLLVLAIIFGQYIFLRPYISYLKWFNRPAVTLDENSLTFLSTTIQWIMITGMKQVSGGRGTSWTDVEYKTFDDEKKLRIPSSIIRPYLLYDYMQIYWYQATNRKIPQAPSSNIEDLYPQKKCEDFQVNKQ